MVSGASALSAGNRSSRLEVAIHRDAGWIDTALVATIVAASLFNLVLEALTPVLIVAAMGAFVLLRWDRLHWLLRDGWPILLLPMFALLSATWSSIPATAAYYALLYLVTIVAALMIGLGMKPGNVLQGYFLGFALFTVPSVLSLRFADWSGGEVFVGLTQSKNAAGDMAGVGLLITMCYFFSCLHGRRFMGAFLAIGLVPFYLFALWFSHATGALIATVLILFITLAWIISRRFSAQARVVIFLGAAVMGIALGLTQAWWFPPLFDAVLQGTGKDAGLTGRTDLWFYADNLIARRPWFGVGYNSFWIHNNLDAEFLWRKLGIKSRMGFNFHSTHREILVHLGYVGLALFATVAVIGAGRLLVSTVLSPTYERIFACAIVAFYAIKMPFEVVGLTTIHFGTITAVAVIGMGYRKLSKPA